jgi:hypothetical protein
MEAGNLVLLALLVGVVRRDGLVRRCVSFVVYIEIVLLFEILVGLSPARFWNWTFWEFKQSTYDVLKLVVAVELTIKALAAFPGTWQMARRVNTFILLAMALGWLLIGAPGRPLVHTATIWLFAGTALVATYFHIPLHAWHRAILYGFTAYLTVFSTIVNIWTRHGFAEDLVRRLGSMDQFAYIGLVAFWAYAAWRPAERFEGVDDAVLRQLHLDEGAVESEKVPAPSPQPAG